MTRTSIEGLFPTPVGFYRWDEGINEKEKKLIQDLPQRTNQGNMTSEDSFLFQRRDLRRIKQFAEECISDFVENVISPGGSLNLYITQAWANYTKPGQYHHKHAHPNSIISGVFYISANQDSDRIKFFNDTVKTVKPPTEKFNIFNSESWWFPVQTNLLLLFPSSTTHMVETVEGDHDRISLSFNTFWRGELGSTAELTYLKLDK